MEIPSKDVAYDPEKDVILNRAARILYGNEVGLEKLKQIDWGARKTSYSLILP